MATEDTNSILKNEKVAEARKLYREAKELHLIFASMYRK